MVLPFVLSVVTLLAVPGPTNTLLAASGAAVGFRKSLRLVAGEISGYLVAIVILKQILAPFVAGAPAGPIVAKAFASVVLVLLAVRLWRHAEAEIAAASGPISVGQVFVTTLFNPKALIFAFVIFPRSDLQETVRLLALFSMLVIAIGCAWIALGRVIRSSAGRRATHSLIARCAAVALTVFAAVIAGSAVTAAMS
jgi:threonine/homoserine/homoserine lactone efflux protein